MIFSPLTPPAPASALPPKWYRRWWGVLLLLILGLGISLGFAIIFRTLQLVGQIQTGEISLADLSGQSVSANSNLSTDQRAALASGGSYPFLGNAQAPIVIVEFGDFNCPYTKQSVAVLKDLVNRYPQDIKVVWRDFAVLDPISSPLAALAGQCAFAQGNFFFWALHDKLFDLQGDLTMATITAAAAASGLDMSQFSVCLSTQRYAADVRADITTGIELGARGTPTFYVNGHSVSGHQELTNWQQAIESLK